MVEKASPCKPEPYAMRVSSSFSPDFEVFSAFFSFMLYFHFGWSHITSVMVADVSNANLRLYMESMGIPMLTELGSLFAMNFFLFFAWVIFTMIALISENAHWVVWLIVAVGGA